MSKPVIDVFAHYREVFERDEGIPAPAKRARKKTRTELMVDALFAACDRRAAPYPAPKDTDALLGSKAYRDEYRRRATR